MPAKTLAFGDDPLGLADGSTVILASLDPKATKDFIEGDDEAGVPLEADAIKPRDLISLSYELRTGASIEINFNVAMGTNYLVTGLTIRQSSSARVGVDLTLLKPSAANKIKAGTLKAVTINGGVGVVNLFGATCAGEIVTLNATYTPRLLEALLTNGSDYPTDGVLTYGVKRTVTGEGYGAFTPPSGASVTEKNVDPRKSRDGWNMHSINYFDSP